MTLTYGSLCAGYGGLDQWLIFGGLTPRERKALRRKQIQNGAKP